MLYRKSTPTHVGRTMKMPGMISRLLWSWLISAAATVGALHAADTAQRLPSAVIPNGLGVNIHFTDAMTGELEMLRDGGFRFVRMDFTWAAIERKAGQYDFAAYDRLLAALEKNHLRAVLILDYGNPLFDGGNAPASEAGRAAFVRWVAASVTHFRNRGVVWEMWNEPNILFWKPKPDVASYAQLALAVGKAIRQTPEIARELYIGPATSTMDFKFLEACLDAEGDVVFGCRSALDRGCETGDSAASLEEIAGREH
jgi:polysaccharide biosynthesis protein PslG